MAKIILTTGGTGGHIFPALAVAEILREKKIEILFIGATYGLEAELTAKAGIPFVGLPSRGFMGRGIRALPAAWDLLSATARAVAKVREFNPGAVAAFGGYASFAPALAALLLRKPLLLHEQNAIAGASNRLLSRFAEVVCASLPATIGLKKPFLVTGNPIRATIQKRGENICLNGKRLLVLGGSQGAHALNGYIARILPELKAAGVKVRHQTGAKDYEQMRQAYLKAGYNPDSVVPFIEDMGASYAWANLALCRAGASTVAELCMSALPAILVPFPSAIHDHQTQNAKVLADAGAAVLMPESELDKTGKIILKLLANPEKLARMSRVAYSLAKPNAARDVAAEIIKLCPKQ